MSRFAAALGALVLLAGVFITYINHEVIDPDAAGARASEALAEDPELRAAIAPQIVESIDGLPIIGGLAADSVGGGVADTLATPAATEAFGEAVSNTVADLTSDNRPEPLVLNLAQVGTEAATGVSSSPLDLVTDQVDSLNVDLSEVDMLLDTLDLAGEVEPIGVPLIVIGVLLLLSALLLAPGIREGLLAAGLSVGVVGVLGIAALIIGRTLLGNAFDSETTRDAVVATWDALGGDLMTAIIVATVVGFVVALGAALALRGRGPEPAMAGYDPGPAARRYEEPARPRRSDPPPPPVVPEPPPALRYDDTRPTERNESPAPGRFDDTRPTERNEPPPRDRDEDTRPTELNESPRSDDTQPTERNESPGFADTRPTELNESPPPRRGPPPPPPPPEGT